MPEDAHAAITHGRTITEEYTYHNYTVRLYEAPPNRPPVRFADLFTFVNAPLSMTPENDRVLTLKMWWRAERMLDRDYSYILLVSDSAGETVWQSDQALTVNQRPTSQWSVGDELEFTKVTLELPRELPAALYKVYMGVYYWETPQLLTIQPQADIITLENSGLLELGVIALHPE